MNQTYATSKVYYPVAGVELQIRLEEFTRGLPEQALAALGEIQSDSHWLPDGFWETPEEEDSQGTRDARALTIVVRTVPRSMNIRCNPYRLADECSVTLRYEDIPLDPRLIRSIGIAAYLGTVPAQDWARAMGGGLSVADTVLDRRASAKATSLIRPEMLRFCGFVDEAEMSWDDDGNLSLKARDCTAPLIDTPVPTKAYRDIDWGRPIEEVVLQVFGYFPGGMDRVSLYCVGFEPGTEYAVKGRIQTGGKAGLKPVRGPKATEETFWDLLTDLTVGNGFVMYAEPYQGPNPSGGQSRPTVRFVLARPRTLYDDGSRGRGFKASGRVKDGHWTITTGQPFQMPLFADRGRVHPSGGTADAPVFVYGEQIERLTIGKRMGRTEVSGIELVQANGAATPMRAQYPTKDSDLSKRTAIPHPSGKRARENIKQFVVSGYASEAEMALAAEQLFHEMARGDLRVSFDTKDMASLGGGNLDPDTLELRPGSPVEVLFPREAEGGRYGETRRALETMSKEEFSRYLQANGMDQTSADALAQAVKRPEVANLLVRRFYTQEVTHSWSDTGYSASVTAVNYQVARIERGGANGSA